MKILTATTATQGSRENDFNFCVEGELVWIQEVCATDKADPDGGCGCGRAFAGLNSHRATTTAQVRDLPMSRDDVIKAFDGYLQTAGYDTVDAEELADEVDDMLDMVSTWVEGAIVERRLERLQVRSVIR